MKNPNEPAHKTRDHRFAYISRGDITSFARGTSKFKYPEPKNTKDTFTPITSKSACAMKTVARKLAHERVVMLASAKQGKPSALSDLEGTGMVADMIDRALEISKKINAQFGLK